MHMRIVHVSSLVAPVGASLFALALAGCGDKAPQERLVLPGPPPTPTIEQLRAAPVTGVFEQAVTLAEGRYEGEPVEPGAASRPQLVLWEPSVRFGDVDGAPGSEGVAMLSSSSGGSGEFVYVAVFGVREGTLANLGTAPVGDRTRLQSLWLERGRIIMDVIEAGPQDAACCPTQVARKTFAMEGGALKQLSSEVRGVLALSMLSANEWTLIEIDGQPLPKDVDTPLIHFAGDKLRGFAGCNRFTAPVTESKPGEIDIGTAGAEKKACPPPQMELEQKFLAQLGAVNRYTYVAGQLALGWQDGERSGVLLFRK
jgi:heat shock protein HslJ